VFYDFHKHHTEIVLETFDAKVCKKHIFKPIVGNASLHKFDIDNGGRVLNFATSRNLTV
jgi:hypothetical protein